jgi:hypothetical protein
MEDIPLFKPEQQKQEKRISTAVEKSSRTLKIEEDGDRYHGGVKPKIRLRGNWLDRAGFKAGERVSVTCVAVGFIELRSHRQTLEATEAV